MKIHHFYLIVALTFSLLSPQVAAELKVGFVNVIKVMDQAPQVDMANRRLEREFAPRKRRLVSAGQAIKTLEKRFAKNATIMSDSQARKLSREIRDKKRDLKRQQEEFQEDLNIRRNEELDKVQKVIFQVIQALAKRESYDFILGDGVVWTSKRVDITDKVLQLLRNQQKRQK